jgi:hypothetical protein
MLIKIIGWIWICSGLILVIAPGILRWQVQRKSNRIIKRYLLAIAIVIAILIYSIGSRISNVPAKVLTLVILLAFVRFVFILKARVLGRIVDFLKKQPIVFFRMWALAQLILGSLMVLFS